MQKILFSILSSFIFFSGCSTELVVRKVKPDSEVQGLRYYLTQPLLRISTFEINDVYEDKSESPTYTRVKLETEFLPNINEMYEVNYDPGCLTKNQFSWTYDDKLGSTLKSLTINSESQVPETLKGIAEIPKGLAELAKEIKPFETVIAKKKIAEKEKLIKVEYKRIEEGTIIP